MVVRFGAVYHDGAFHPTTDVDISEGTKVELEVLEQIPNKRTEPLEVNDQILTADNPSISSGRRAFEKLKRIAELPDEPCEKQNVTSMNVDEILYGGQSGVR